MRKKFKFASLISTLLLILSMSATQAHASSEGSDRDDVSCSENDDRDYSSNSLTLKSGVVSKSLSSSSDDDSDDDSCGGADSGNSGKKDKEKKPATLTAAVISNCSTTVTISWVAPAASRIPAVDKYKIRYSSNGGTTWTNYLIQPTQSPHTLSGLPVGTNYIFQIAAHNVNGWGNWSNSSSSCLVSAQSGTSFTFSIDGLSNIPGIGIDYSTDGLTLTETFIATVTGAQSGTLVKGKFDHDLYISLPAGINYSFSVNGTTITPTGYTFFPVASAMGGNNPVTLGTNSWFYDFAQTYAFDIVSGSSIAIVILP